MMKADMRPHYLPPSSRSEVERRAPGLIMTVAVRVRPRWAFRAGRFCIDVLHIRFLGLFFLRRVRIETSLPGEPWRFHKMLRGLPCHRD